LTRLSGNDVEYIITVVDALKDSAEDGGSLNASRPGTNSSKKEVQIILVIIAVPVFRPRPTQAIEPSTTVIVAHEIDTLATLRASGREADVLPTVAVAWKAAGKV